MTLSLPNSWILHQSFVVVASRRIIAVTGDCEFCGVGVYEAEFSDDNGRTYAMAALKAERLLRLHHEPVHQAAWFAPSLATPQEPIGPFPFTNSQFAISQVCE